MKKPSFFLSTTSQRGRMELPSAPWSLEGGQQKQKNWNGADLAKSNRCRYSKQSLTPPCTCTSNSLKSGPHPILVPHRNVCVHQIPQVMLEMSLNLALNHHWYLNLTNKMGGKAYLAEGNHRLAVAMSEGIHYLPVHVTSQWLEPNE